MGSRVNNLNIDVNSPTYTPERLFETVRKSLGVKSLYKAALVLDIDHGQLSRVINRKDPLTSTLLMRVMDVTQWHISVVRELAGIPFNPLPPQE
jgi:hypothetical protein